MVRKRYHKLFHFEQKIIFSNSFFDLFPEILLLVRQTKDEMVKMVNVLNQVIKHSYMVRQDINSLKRSSLCASNAALPVSKVNPKVFEPFIPVQTMEQMTALNQLLADTEHQNAFVSIKKILIQ